MEWINRFIPYCVGLGCLAVWLWLLVGLLKEKRFRDWLLPNPNVASMQRKKDISGLVEALTHSSPRIRQEARRSLTAVGQQVTLPVLELLNRPKITYETIEAGKRILIDIGEIGPLLDILPNWDYRGQAHQSVIDVLAEIGDETAVPPLTAMFKQPDPRVRKSTKRALQRLASLNTWQILLVHDDARIRTFAARQLCEYEDEQVIPSLLRALSDEFAGVQVFVLLALGQYDDARIGPAVGKLLKSSDLDEVVRQTAVLVIARSFQTEADATHHTNADEDKRPECADCRKRFNWREAYWQTETPGARDRAGYTYFFRVFCPYCGAIVCDDGASYWVWYGDNAWVNVRNELPPVIVPDAEWISDEDWPSYWNWWPLKKKVPRDDLVPYNDERLKLPLSRKS